MEGEKGLILPSEECCDCVYVVGKDESTGEGTGDEGMQVEEEVTEEV